MVCQCEDVIGSQGNAGELPGMIATLASYDRMFGPVHIQTLALVRLVGERLPESGEPDLARHLLERVVRDVVRAGPASDTPSQTGRARLIEKSASQV
jgi:hypothetical protein